MPLGSGLSSSAALEVSVLRALRRLFGLDFDDVALAKLGRAVETDFVGAPIGIMDQMASSLAVVGEALFVDTRTLQTEPVPCRPTRSWSSSTPAWPTIMRTGTTARAARSASARRRCSGSPSCAMWASAISRGSMALPPPLDRRARHVVTENQRVLDAVAAMRAGDAAALGALFDASHASQRDDYECSVPEVDQLVAIAQADPAVFGARLTGGGFGGSIVGLVRAGEGAAVAARVADEYSGRSGRAATVLVPE